MNRLAIIHFQPIELYPPVMNLLNYLSEKQDEEIEVRVFTMKTNQPVCFSAPNVKIIRSGILKKQASFFRYCNYLLFYTSTATRLAEWKPDVILYYETLSVFPAYFYKKFLYKDCRLLIHYHEYTSPEEYRNGMVLSRWLHRLEKKIYPVAAWVSQTNSDRMHFFLEENRNVSSQSAHIMPNYPPSSWEAKKNSYSISLPVKFVYTGALSLDTMYTKEFAEWVIQHQGQMIWDIYSTNITEDAMVFLSSLKTSYVQFHGGVNYFSLPDVLQRYDIGVILYKGHIPNYIYNAPNKLFEYWACGLDVWFPEKMSSSLSYTTTDCYPKVIPVNFDEIGQLDVESTISRSGLSYLPSAYYCEQIFDSFIRQCIKGK